MTAEERKQKFDSMAERLLEISRELASLYPELPLVIDQKAASIMVTDLHWAVEHCTTIGLHQIGQALDDQFGVSDEERV